jgi:DNA-binding transcriptional LysR family regulator
VPVSGPLEANNGDVLLAAAKGGAGVARLPTFICGDAVRAGELERLLPGWVDTADAAVYAVYPASRQVSPKLRVFIDFLAARFGPAPYWDRGLA